MLCDLAFCLSFFYVLFNCVQSCFCYTTCSFHRISSWDVTAFLLTVRTSVLILLLRNLEQRYMKHSRHRRHHYHWEHRERCTGAHRNDSQLSQSVLINCSKSQLKPQRKKLFLGFQVDSNPVALSLPDTNMWHIIQDAKTLLQMKRVSAWWLAQLIGKLSAAIEVVQPATLHYRSLQQLKHQALAQGGISKEVKQDLNWWINNLPKGIQKHLTRSSPSFEIETDASQRGMGTYLKMRGRPHSRFTFKIAYGRNELHLPCNTVSNDSSAFYKAKLLRDTSAVNRHAKAIPVNCLPISVS